MGEIRIVAGEFRRRKLRVFPGAQVRPTSDRVREALFDILGADVDAAHVLDAFAGTGALGLEALSRGAAHVTFLESDREIAAALRENVDRLGALARSSMVLARAEIAVAGALPGGPFDLVLADPPYSDPVRRRFLGQLASSGHLSPDARVVVETDGRDPSAAGSEAGLQLERSERYGRTRLEFYRLSASGLSTG